MSANPLEREERLRAWDTGGAWLSSAHATAGDKPEEGEDDVKSSCPGYPGRHACYNGRVMDACFLKVKVIGISTRYMIIVFQLKFSSTGMESDGRFGQGSEFPVLRPSEVPKYN
ncbi:Unknown protein [Striga hermonthica]|uniref:Uncharacterized protein n=1 Tax=Striga hermonthica TaxID=68872 RepID=A0A9N7MTR4_STRHE|nr:Unknown protein [Striga hermonthica]